MGTIFDSIHTLASSFVRSGVWDNSGVLFLMKINMEQSFWFEGVAFDKKDYPVCEPEYTETIERKSSLFDDYNLFDYSYGTNRYIRLSELLEADSKEEWVTIRENARECDSITILNDIEIENWEISFISEFYLKTFYSALKKENPKCYICDMKE